MAIDDLLSEFDSFLEQESPPQIENDDLLGEFDNFVIDLQEQASQVEIPEPPPFEFSDPTEGLGFETMPSATTSAVPYDVRPTQQEPLPQQPQELPAYQPGQEYRARDIMAEDIKTRAPRPSTPAAAFLTGIEQSIPFVGAEGQDIEQIKREHSGSVGIGEVTGHTAQALAGGLGVGKLLAKTAISKSPLLLSTLSRVIPAIGIRGAQTTEDVIQNKTDIGDALFDTLVESGGGAAFSMVPELLLPTGVAQAVAQPLADVMYQAGVDAVKQGGDTKGIFTKKWFKQQIPTIAMSLGFGLKDVADPEFKAMQKAMRGEIKGAFKGKPKAKPQADPEVDIPQGIPYEEPEGDFKLDMGKDEELFVPSDEIRGSTEYEEAKSYVPGLDKVQEADKQKFFEPMTEAEVKELESDFDTFRAEEPKEVKPQQEIEPEPTKPTIEDEPEGDYKLHMEKDEALFNPEDEIQSQIEYEKTKKYIPDLDELSKTDKKKFLEPLSKEEIEAKPQEPIKLDPETQEAVIKEDDFKRKRGLAAQAGAIGGKKQYAPEFKSPEAKEMQKVFEGQRKAVKKKFGFNLEKSTDKWLSRFIDEAAPWKRKLNKNTDDNKVIIAHNLAKGAPGEAVRSYEIKEKEIYSGVAHDKENMLADFIQAKRSVELLKTKGEEFKTPGGDKNQKWLDELKQTDPQLYKSLETAQKKYTKAVGKEPIQELVKEGILSKDVADKLLSEHENYSPRRFLERIDPDGEGFTSGGSKMTNPDSGIKRLKEGSDQALVNNPRLLLSEIEMRTKGRVFKNRANKELYDMVSKNPENKLGAVVEEPGKADQKVPPGMTRISSYVDGKKQSVLMPTEIAKYWVGQEPKVNQDLAKALNVVSGSAILKPMATGLNPGFAVSNMARDLFHSWFVTKEYSPILPIAWAQQAKDIATVMGDVVKRKGRVVDYSKDGGSMELMTHQGQLKKEPWKPQTPMGESFRQIQKSLGWVGETSELLTRIALRERAIKNGKTPKEATAIARDYIDFSQGGTWTKAANNAVPYLNAGVQGTRGVFRAVKDDPKIATFKAAQIVSMGFGLAIWNRMANPEAWDSVSDREKVTNHIITTPFSRTDKDGNKRHIYFKIAKDQGQRIFGTIGEELAEMAQTGKMNFEKLQHSIKDFIPIEMGVSIPTFSAIWGYMYNKDFWRNQDIWKGRKGISPKEERWNETPKVWKMLGDATGLSPERSKSAFHTVVPKNVYTYLVGGMASEMMSTLSDKDKEEVSKPFISHLTKTPISKRLIGETYPRGRQTEDLLKRASGMNLKLDQANGKPIPYEELKRRVESEERKVSDQKIRNDREFDFLATASLMGNEDTKKNFKEAYQKLLKDNPKEYKRIRNRLKRKHKKDYYKLIQQDIK